MPKDNTGAQRQYDDDADVDGVDDDDYEDEVTDEDDVSWRRSKYSFTASSFQSWSQYLCSPIPTTRTIPNNPNFVR